MKCKAKGEWDSGRTCAYVCSSIILCAIRFCLRIDKVPKAKWAVGKKRARKRH